MWKEKIENILKQIPRRPIVFENISNTEPVSRLFGFDRGTPIDRYFIEKYLKQHQKDIHGRLLEIADNTYSKKYGSNVTAYDILHYDKSNDKATIIGDLSKPDSLPEGIIDCFICTQTLNFIFDVQKAITGLYKILKSNGGVCLCTVSGISQISRYDMDKWGDYWRFTDLSIRRLFESVFDKNNIEITTYGNVLSANAFLQGLSVEDLSSKKLLDKHDIDYQVTIGIRAIK